MILKVCLLLSVLMLATCGADLVKGFCLAFLPNFVKAYKCLDAKQDNVVSKCIAESLAPQPTWTLEEYLTKACDHKTFDKVVDQKYTNCTKKAEPLFSQNLELCLAEVFLGNNTSSA